MEIGKKIKEIAEAKNISVKDLGEKIGRTRQAVYDIYTGKVSVNVELLNKICAVLGIEVYTLFVAENDLPQTKDELKRIIGGITSQVINNNYIFAIHVRELMLNIHMKAKEGMGLINLEFNSKLKASDYPFVEHYKPLKTAISKPELQKYSEHIYGNFFKNLMILMHTQDFSKVISDIIDRDFSKKGSDIK
jgi:transcriptional regulator with XRE-family HTH domain